MKPRFYISRSSLDRDDKYINRLISELKKKYRVYDPLSLKKLTPKRIVDRDLEAIEYSDFLIWYNKSKSDGAPVEAYHAYNFAIPVITIICNEEYKSPFMEVFSHYLIERLPLKNVLKQIEGIINNEEKRPYESL